MEFQPQPTHEPELRTARLTLTPMTPGELEEMIAKTRREVPELSRAYEEMLSNCRRFPKDFLWNTAWKMALSEDGAEVGNAGFKGLSDSGVVEIGYGIEEEFQGKGFATEGAAALCAWALDQPGISAVEAETEPENRASRRVLEKIGFQPTGENGAEGPRFRLTRSKTPDLLKLSDENLRRARKVVQEAGILPAWERLGATVNPVGSCAMGLIMTHRDVDFHVYLPELNAAQSFQAMAEICARPGVTRMEFRNLANTPEECFEFHIWVAEKLPDGSEEEWQIDLIQILPGSRFDGFFERVAQRIRDVLTPETRLAILRLKYETPPGEHIMGIEYYQAVLEGGVRSWDEFRAWRAARGEAGIIEWMP